MRMFVSEERLLIAIHEGRTEITGEKASTFGMLLGRGLVSGNRNEEGVIVDASLTSAGKEVLWEILRRD
ncbi:MULTISPECIES: hypothetical protein [Pseudomonas]|uniref:hypothetical protein n=1 Tax=Pseudomonas TaxID=286 RepID=UPI0018A57CAD|nr:hypothetical protein [Pseudomonas monteilii]BBV98203.1 hypothetical protein STW0522PSE72_35540 [Pseudomonas monteilii]